VSPGVFINEIDNSQLPREAEPVGPAVIGRLSRGPGNRPVTVGSFSEFIEIFGNPIAGGQGGDVWREGNLMAPTYAAYAAQAYLRNSSPVTVVRLLGVADPNADSTTDDGTVAGASAGWKTDNTLGASGTTAGGAYGLYLFTSGSTQRDLRNTFDTRPRGVRAANRGTGSLAAVFYFDKGGIILTGSTIAGSTGSAFAENGATGSAIAIKTNNANLMEFTAQVFENQAVTTTPTKIVFNFDRDSDRYIRKVFNTNPALCSAVNAKQKYYWLGETFDRHVKDTHAATTNIGQGSLAADGSLYGVIVGLNGSATGQDWGIRNIDTQPSKTGWFFSQDLTNDSTNYNPANMQKLFRLVTLDDGEWSAKNLKVTITDIRKGSDSNPYGTFTVVLRQVRDHDGAPRAIERFSQCDLNPNSNNFVAKKIGDMYQEWDTSQNRYRLYGNYPNQSSFVRVVLNGDVENGASDPACLPAGFYGPPVPRTIGIGVTTDKVEFTTRWATEAGFRTTLTTNNLIDTDTIILSRSMGTMLPIAAIPANSTASIIHPRLPLRISSSDEGLSNQKDACFGVSTYRSPSSTRFEESYLDLVIPGPSSFGYYDATSTSEPSFIFSLDDLMINQTASHAALAPADATFACYASGSRRVGRSYTAERKSFSDLLDTGFASFTAPLFGGFDGINIKQKDPFGDHVFGSTPTFKSNYAAHSIKRGIDSLADPEQVEINMMAVPGVRKPLLTNRVLEVCESRADALAIIDVEKGGYAPSTETTNDFKTRITNNSVAEAVSAIKSRGMNNSYGCAYFPWVKIYDAINDSQVWVPPSVVAIGTFGSVERNSELWFAPAGFTRGGLSEGSAGLPVVGVSQRLTSKERDDLYERNINPIATFPAEGIVIFGQKTLQSTRSALDRINVRRLMIFVKKEISRIASRLLFDQNVQSTWNRFRGQVEPFLDSVKARLGLTDFRVILDDTTTTPDLIDRNIMYAKIFLKPARAIEFIAIDFVITNTGASFED